MSKTIYCNFDCHKFSYHFSLGIWIYSIAVSTILIIHVFTYILILVWTTLPAGGPAEDWPGHLDSLAQGNILMQPHARLARSREHPPHSHMPTKAHALTLPSNHPYLLYLICSLTHFPQSLTAIPPASHKATSRPSTASLLATHYSSLSSPMMATATRVDPPANNPMHTSVATHGAQGGRHERCDGDAYGQRWGNTRRGWRCCNPHLMELQPLEGCAGTMGDHRCRVLPPPTGRIAVIFAGRAATDVLQSWNQRPPVLEPDAPLTVDVFFLLEPPLFVVGTC